MKPTFANEEEAWRWIMDEADDPCVDNGRLAYLDDPISMKEYEKKKAEGCCGFIDEEIVIGGRNAIIGCNYGH